MQAKSIVSVKVTGRLYKRPCIYILERTLLDRSVFFVFVLYEVCSVLKFNKI